MVTVGKILLSVISNTGVLIYSTAEKFRRCEPYDIDCHISGMPASFSDTEKGCP
jgi:hypothetical protein